jgi:hypothetical protein
LMLAVHGIDLERLSQDLLARRTTT